jgi:hypothetical protein
MEVETETEFPLPFGSQLLTLTAHEPAQGNRIEAAFVAVNCEGHAFCAIHIPSSGS